MHKFFVNDNQINNESIKIIGEDYNHIANVLRMKNGQKILVTNKSTNETFDCIIKDINSKEVICNIIDLNTKNVEMNVNVDIFQGLPKADKMEFIIQKCVELGVHKIIPVNMKYCVAKIKDEDKKNERWNKISEVASKQCKRNIIPKIDKSININELYSLIQNYDLAILAYENEDNITIKDILKEHKDIKSIAVIVGPEGGLSPEEVKGLIKAGAKVVSLGNRILRTETAPIAMLSMIMYEYEL